MEDFIIFMIFIDLLVTIFLHIDIKTSIHDLSKELKQHEEKKAD